MTVRQKVLVALLNATQETSPTVFVKLAFLLGRETEISQRCPFYEFVPYRFGPFSFQLYQELGNLEQSGYCHRSEVAIKPVAVTQQQAAARIAELPAEIRGWVGEIARKYGSLSREALLKDVYRRYAWYASRSELTDYLPDDVPQPPSRRIAIYTLGYQGESVDHFFNRVLMQGIKRILDVRANPVSRVYGFAGRTFSDNCRKLGIGYVHIPELGIPSEKREGLGSAASYERVLRHYSDEILPSRQEHVSRAGELIAETPTALLCMEKEPQCCHRSRLADLIATQRKLSVVNL